MKQCPIHPGDRHLDPNTGRCATCQGINNGERVGKTRLRLQDRPLRHTIDADVTMKAMADNVEEAKKFLKAITSDPVRASQLYMAAARPKGVSVERFNIACRAAGREPMLNANPESINRGLDYNRAEGDQRKKALPKAGVVERVAVKPCSLRNAKYGRNSAYWGTREWLIFALKYGKGYVVRTDVGDESMVFPSVGQLKSAIRKSGWEIPKA